MAKVLSENTANWLKNQINSRDLSSKPRKSVIIGSGGGGGVSGAVIAKITSKNANGTYSFELNSGGTTSSERIFPVKNSMSLPGLYEEGDYVLVHLVTLDVVSAGGTSAEGE